METSIKITEFMEAKQMAEYFTKHFPKGRLSYNINDIDPPTMVIMQDKLEMTFEPNVKQGWYEAHVHIDDHSIHLFTQHMQFKIIPLENEAA